MTLSEADMNIGIIALYYRYYCQHQKQEAQLPQRDRAWRYVSNFVLCFTKGFLTASPSRPFKCIGNGAILYATYDFY